MKRIKQLNRYQMGTLILLAAMFVVFTVVYAVFASRAGFEYHGAILRPEKVGSSTVYSGRISGKDAVFTVTADKSVTFQYGEMLYGPFTAREDPSAIPEDAALSSRMTGVELRRGEDVIFRGGVLASSGENPYWIMLDEEGESVDFQIGYSSGGIMYDASGNRIDEMEPSLRTILSLMAGPELTSRGTGMAWLCGVMSSVIAALLILFADELFRLNMSLRIRDAYLAEPSELEMMSRYLSWFVLTLIALVSYILGLTV